MELPSVLIFLGSYLSITGSIYGLFDKAGKVIDPESRKAVTRWLKNLDLPEKLNWPSMFVALFDRVFTEKHLSWRCFFRSSVASVAAVVIVTLITETFFQISTREEFPLEGILALFSVAFIALLCNLFPDYVSLLETRLVMRRMMATDSRLCVVGLLVFDMVATLLIFYIAILVILILVVFGPEDFGFSLLEVTAETVWAGLTFSTTENVQFTAGILVYSTFFTSVWLWLYALSGFLVKGIAATRTGLHFLQRHLNLEEHPLRSMGFVLMLLVTVGYVVWGAALVF